MGSAYFSTRQFVFAHGHEPRGRGSWAFDFGGVKLPEGDGRIFWVHGQLYSEAKKRARALAASPGMPSGGIEIEVLS